MNRHFSNKFKSKLIMTWAIFESQSSRSRRVRAKVFSTLNNVNNNNNIRKKTSSSSQSCLVFCLPRSYISEISDFVRNN